MKNRSVDAGAAATAYDAAALPGGVPGRRRSDHQMIILASAVLLPVVLLAPVQVAVLLAVAVLLLCSS